MSTTTTRTRLRAAAALALIAAAAPIAAAPAQAGAGTTSALCTEQFKATVTPGFTATPSAGTVTSGGQTGAITCIGKIGGADVTGPGSIGFDETYANGTCTSDSTVGTVRVTIPTTAGVKHLVGPFTTQRTALAFTIDVRFPGARYSGLGVIAPLQGTCLLTPLRRVSITLTGSLKSA